MNVLCSRLFNSAREADIQVILSVVCDTQILGAERGSCRSLRLQNLLNARDALQKQPN